MRGLGNRVGSSCRDCGTYFLVKPLMPVRLEAGFLNADFLAFMQALVNKSNPQINLFQSGQIPTSWLCVLATQLKVPEKIHLSVQFKFWINTK